MRPASILPFAAAAASFVLPEIGLFRKLSIETSAKDEGSWWDKVPSKQSILSAFEDGLDAISSQVDDAFTDAASIFEWDQENSQDDSSADRPHHGHRGGHHQHHSNLTIYQLISKSNYTTKFAKLVDKYDDLVKLLNSTDANYTLFVPTDKAFEHIPDHHKKPSDDVLEALLRYHIGVGFYPAGRVLVSPTIPTALDEALLGGEPQRLRTSFGFGGLHVNFYSKVIAANFEAKNGVIHALSHILVPPPFVGKELSLLPSEFSTLLHAYEKTDFVKFIHGIKTNGTTVFAPTNGAFARLGHAANAFLFNTEKGLGYLKALLKYQIVANTTLYSNALYENDADDKDVETESERQHLELHTLLGGKSLGVDISRWAGFVKIRVNGYVPVVVRDVVAKNGVLQVVGRLPIPPHKHKGAQYMDEDNDKDISVKDLIQRLEPFVESAEDTTDEIWTEL